LTRRLIVLSEYEAKEVELSADSARDIAQLAAGRIDVRVGSRPGAWVIAATQHVGTVVTPEVEILVRPKIPIENLFLLLDVELPKVAWGPDLFGYAATRDLLAALAELFGRQVHRAVGAGLLRSYRRHDERLVAMRGRLDIPRLVRHSAIASPIACTFEDYTSDIDENRFLKAAVRHLLRIPGVQPGTRRLLKHELTRFEEVDDVWPDPDLVDRIVFTRLNRHYEPALRLGRLILRNLGLIDRAGTNDASAFLLDMNELFQRWVTDRLRRLLRGRVGVLDDSGQPVYLGVGRRVPMAPDLRFVIDGQLVYVGDCKYKITESGLGRSGDYYQLLAYTTALDVPQGVLIYCQHSGQAPEREVVVRYADKRLLTYPLHLAGDRDAVDASMRGLARWIWDRVRTDPVPLTLVG
jgi:5-methylcytosine-specific restriction enzyme subunit McrC